MDRHDYIQAKHHLLSAANIMAPNGKVQQAFGKLINACERDGMDDDHILKQIVGSIFDGLAYGNWIGQFPMTKE